MLDLEHKIPENIALPSQICTAKTSRFSLVILDSTETIIRRATLGRSQRQSGENKGNSFYKHFVRVKQRR
jgi:hypothetical protein